MARLPSLSGNMVTSSEAFVASIASTLNASNVPCVLWGHCLMMLHGIPTILGTIDFVVPDELMPQATKALGTIPHIVPCPDGEGCIDDPHCQDRHTPPPAAHMHIEDSDVTATLYLQSETLWFLPSIDANLLPRHHSNMPSEYLLATDKLHLPPERPGRGPGYSKFNGSPVVIVKAHVFLEALLRLYARDCLKTIGGAGIPMICYVSQYVDSDGYLDASELPENLQRLYHQQHEVSTMQWRKDLRRELEVPLEWSEDDNEFI